jgi:cytochrome c-type biogenesis protein CcmH/NrfG
MTVVRVRQEATLLSAAGDLGDAETRLRAALDAQPSDAMTWFLLGEVLLQRGERNQARVAFLQAARCPVLPDAGIEEATLHGAAQRRAASLTG